jgi:hypothetical protein
MLRVEVMSRWSVLITLPLCAACYSYVPVEPSALPQGTAVRARITSEQAERVEPLVGRELRVLEGVVVGAGADSVLLEVPTAARVGTGGSLQVLHQRVAIARAGITEVELKRLNRGRTTLLVVGGGAVVGYLLLDALNIGPGRESPRRGDGGTDMRIPLFVLRH